MRNLPPIIVRLEVVFEDFSVEVGRNLDDFVLSHSSNFVRLAV